MSNPNETENKELADRLWEQQGKREDHSTGDWLEAEYRAHPPIVSLQDETDLRMRGLGPLATDHSAKAEEVPANVSAGRWLFIAAGVFVGLGVLYSVARRVSA